MVAYIECLPLLKISESAPGLPKYGSTIIKSFLGTEVTIIFDTYTLQEFFHTFVNKVTWITIFMQNTFKYIFFMMEFHKIRE